MEYFLGRNAWVFEDFPKFPCYDFVFSWNFGVCDFDGVPEGHCEVFLEVMERWRVKSGFLLCKVFLILFALEAWIFAFLLIWGVNRFWLRVLLDQKLIQIAIGISFFEVGDAVGTVVYSARQEVLGRLMLLFKENVDLVDLAHLQKIIILISDGLCQLNNKI